MAVYTDISEIDLAAFLKNYRIGELYSYKGIAEGVENSNFLLHAESGAYILTLYEKRVNRDDLPFFLALMQHLAARGISCPQPVAQRDGTAIGEVAGRPAAIVTFLEGMWMRRPTVEHCRAVGVALASMHLAGRDFALRRQNALSVGGWRPLWAMSSARADEVEPGLAAETEADLDFLEASWPQGLPQGVIHADLFPDNVFFLGRGLSGLIDFYFACTDILAYDVAVCINAWCFEKDHSYNHTKGTRAARRLHLGPAAGRGGGGSAAGAGARRCAALHADPPARLADRAGRQPRGEEGPDGICAAHALPPGDPLAGGVRPGRGGDGAMKAVEIFTDGACSGNPGPGGWGAVMRYNGTVRELSGGEPVTTNNRMELTAAISALNALKEPCLVDLHTDSEYVRNGIRSWIDGWKRNGWKTSAKKPVKNAELWQALDEARRRHEVVWHWVKGHSGHPENERADELARVAMAPYKPQKKPVGEGS